MRKLIYSLTIILLISKLSLAEKIPPVVKSAMNQKFPGATHVKWEKENDIEFEASFKWNNLNYSANFNEQGALLETEMEFKFNELPEKIRNAFTVSHPAVKVKEVAKISTASGNIKYEVEFNAGIKNSEVFYTSEGVETKE